MQERALLNAPKKKKPAFGLKTLLQYCFIGDVLIGTKEFEEALKNISSSDAKKIARGIAIAAHIEQESMDYYSKQAERFSDAQMRDFFVFLAGQEKEHFTTINALKKSLEKNGKWIEPKILAKKHAGFFAKKDWDKEQSAGEGITAILFALWKEKQAREFYLGIVARTKNAAGKRFFSALADFEKGHAEMLESFVENSYYTQELIMG